MQTTSYIVNEKGQRISAIVPIKQYQHLLDELEEMNDIRLYDEAKADKEPSIPIEEAFKIIESKRKKK
jgi:hypothetical protein